MAVFAVMEIGPTEYERWATTTQTDTDLVAMTKRVYDSLPDQFDSLVFMNNEEVARPGVNYSAIRYPVKNDTTGLGLSLFDNSAVFGSAGRLQGIIHAPTGGILLPAMSPTPGTSAIRAVPGWVATCVLCGRTRTEGGVGWGIARMDFPGPASAPSETPTHGLLLLDMRE